MLRSNPSLSIDAFVLTSGSSVIIDRRAAITHHRFPAAVDGKDLRTGIPCRYRREHVASFEKGASIPGRGLHLEVPSGYP